MLRRQRQGSVDVSFNRIIKNYNINSNKILFEYYNYNILKLPDPTPESYRSP